MNQPASSERQRAQFGPMALKDPNSVEFAYQLIEDLKFKWQLRQLREQDWEQELDKASKLRIYERIPPEHPYGSLDTMLRAELGVGLEESRSALHERIHLAAESTTGEVLPEGRRPGATIEQLDELSSYTQAERAKNGGIGLTTQKQLDRLARDYPVLFERVKAGELTVNRAAILAGIVHPPTPLQLLQKAWRKASADEQERFRDWINA